jgi:hypothetical protein
VTYSYGRIDFFLFFSFARRLIKTSGIHVIFNHTRNGSEIIFVCKRCSHVLLVLEGQIGCYHNVVLLQLA